MSGGRGNPSQYVKDARCDHVSVERFGLREIPFDVGRAGEAASDGDPVRQYAAHAVASWLCNWRLGRS